MNLEKELAVAKEAAVKAGYAIMDVYENAEDMQISYKDGDMPLTAADKASNRIIVDALKEAFPEYAILSEEEKDDLSRLDNDLKAASAILHNRCIFLIFYKVIHQFFIPHRIQGKVNTNPFTCRIICPRTKHQ